MVGDATVNDCAMTLAQAIREVEQGQRIASPGKWKVWREGDKVKHEVLK